MSIALKMAMLMGSQTRLLASEIYVNAGISQDVSFAGATAGCLALIIAQCESGTIGATPSGWSVLSSYFWPDFGYTTTVITKVLAGADMATGHVAVTSTNGLEIIMAAFYSNATTPSVKATVQSGEGDTTLPLGGFTKAVNSKAIVSWVIDRDIAGSGITPPSALQSRIAPTSSTKATGAYADQITPNAYTNGAALTWTGFPGGNSQVGQLIELT